MNLLEYIAATVVRSRHKSLGLIGQNQRHWTKQELSYRQQIARQLRTQYADGIYKHKYCTVTLKPRLSVTQDH